MDLIQPVCMELKNNPKLKQFINIIQDAVLYKAGDLKPYWYSATWTPFPLEYFATPEEAFLDAIGKFPDKNDVTKIYSIEIAAFILTPDLKKLSGLP